MKHISTLAGVICAEKVFDIFFSVAVVVHIFTLRIFNDRQMVVRETIPIRLKWSVY